MGDEVDDLWAKVLEQVLALEGLQRATADAKARQKPSHAELLKMMAQIGYADIPSSHVTAKMPNKHIRTELRQMRDLPALKELDNKVGIDHLSVRVNS